MVKETQKKSQKITSKVHIILALLLLVTLAGLAFVSYGYWQATQRIDLLTQAQNEMSQEEIDTLLAEVSAHMLLPADETPAIATIFDAKALAETQSFFKQAVDGDKVIIYSDKAIIFRPKEGLIINVGPVIKDAPPVELGEDGQPVAVEENTADESVEEVVNNDVPAEVDEVSNITEEVPVETELTEPVEEETEVLGQEENAPVAE